MKRLQYLRRLTVLGLLVVAGCGGSTTNGDGGVDGAVGNDAQGDMGGGAVTCSFVAPTDGASLKAADDKVPGNASFEYDVVVNVQNGNGAQVTLKLDGVAQSPQTAGSDGNATFSSIVLPVKTGLKVTAEVTLSGRVGSCGVTIDVATDAPSCSLGTFSPASVTTPKGAALGPQQDADTEKGGLQTTLTVTTESGVDEVVLQANGTTIATVKPTGTTATFTGVDLPEGKQTVQATCTNSATDKSGKSQTADVWVDTTAPSAATDVVCVVTSPRNGLVDCTWKAGADGEDGVGIEKYQVRYRAWKSSSVDSPVTEQNFNDPSTEKVTPDITPAATDPQKVTLSNIVLGTEVGIAVRGVDYLGNTAPLAINVTPSSVVYSATSLAGTAAGGKFGLSVTTGDFNCDGNSDLAVGVPISNNKIGEVNLFFGDGKVMPTAPSKKIVATLAGGEFGTEIVAVNFDNDADKCTDLAVRAPNLDSGTDVNAGTFNRGRIYLYLGSKTWIDRDDVSTGKGADVIYKLATGSTSPVQLGAGGLGSTDMDGDGMDDVAMTYWIKTPDVNRWASVLVDYGETGVTKMAQGVSPTIRQMPEAADVVLAGGNNKQKENFGVVLVRGGLLNKDNYGDLLIGSPGYKDGSANAVGAAYVVLGKARSATPGQETIDVNTSNNVLRIVGSQTEKNEVFGIALAGVGDMNNDGNPEFAIGDSFAGEAPLYPGKVYVFNLSGATPTSVADAKMSITNNFPDLKPSAAMGRRIASGVGINPTKGADLNKDGFADLVIGTQRLGDQDAGAVLVFMGKSGALGNVNATDASAILRPAEPLGISFSRDIRFSTDINGDGYIDIIAAEPSYSSDLGRVVGFY